MRIRRPRTAAIAASIVPATVAALVATGPTQAGPPHRSALAADTTAVARTGAIGVLAQERIGDRTVTARAGHRTATGDQPVPADATFRIGSATKTFVAVTVLQLVAERRLSLDDAIERWLPGLIHGHGNDGAHVTVRQLLQHTCGLYDYAEDPSLRAALNTAAGFERARFRHYDARQLVAVATGHRPAFAPGHGWSYSNTNYLVAGLLIERVTGRSWAGEIHRRILTPLHLRHTAIPGDWPFLTGPHAHGYARFPDATGLIDVTTHNPSVIGASGAMVSTPADLNRFYQALLGDRLLPPAQLRQMQRTVASRPGYGPPGTRAGLGLFAIPLSCGGPLWAHPGDVTGFQTVGGASADGRTSVTVASTGPGADAVTAAELALVDRAVCRARS